MSPLNKLCKNVVAGLNNEVVCHKCMIFPLDECRKDSKQEGLAKVDEWWLSESLQPKFDTF